MTKSDTLRATSSLGAPGRGNETDEALAVMRNITAGAQSTPQIQPERLAAFLSRQPDLGGTLLGVELDTRRRSSGASSGTQLLDVRVMSPTGEVNLPLVFRYDLGGTFFFQYDLISQFHIMKALGPTGFPSPRALWLDAEGEIAGRPGLFMRRVDAPAPSGQPFAEGPLVEAPAPQRRQMILESVRVFAHLHRLDATALPLEFLENRGQGANFIVRALDWDRNELLHAIPAGFGGARAAYYNDVRATLLRCYVHLVSKAPLTRKPELAHGDPNLSNVMYRGTEVAALLDWELCHLGLGEADLAYCLAGMAHFLLTLKPLEGIPTDNELIGAYKSERGKLDDWEFCRLWGEWRLGVYQAMAFSRLPAEMQPVEEMYWNNTKNRLNGCLSL
jgi:aminoglycoside phosphotransferase (APT) family kinase protein